MTTSITLYADITAITAARDALKDRIDARKNHIVGAVECGGDPYVNTGLSGFDYAHKLTKELRELESAYSVFNGAVLRYEGVIS